MIQRYLVMGLAILSGAALGSDQLAPGATPRAQQDALLARFVVELAAERDVAPISLDADGSAGHGAVYDRFVRAHVTARAARLKGAPIDPSKPPSSLLASPLIVVAVPLACGDRIVRPTDVDIDNNGRVVEKWLPATGAAIQPLLPGVTVPAGAIAVQFADPSLEKGEVVRISYAAPVCSGTSRTVSLPVSVTNARALERPSIDVKPGERAPSGPVTLTITGVVDLDGRLRYAAAPEAATPFGALALDAALKMRFEPGRTNGSPTPWTAGIILTFGATDAAAGPSEISTQTPDVPSLTEATSKCPVSRDAIYGLTGSSPIRIGGGVDGAAREMQYLSVLRGPAGQGLQYHGTGPTMVAGSRVILDGFEVRYAGLPRPVRIYFDSSQEAPLMAPKGFACAAPIVAK